MGPRPGAWPVGVSACVHALGSTASVCPGVGVAQCWSVPVPQVMLAMLCCHGGAWGFPGHWTACPRLRVKFRRQWGPEELTASLFPCSASTLEGPSVLCSVPAVGGHPPGHTPAER